MTGPVSLSGQHQCEEEGESTLCGRPAHAQGPTRRSQCERPARVPDVSQGAAHQSSVTLKNTEPS